MNINIYSCFHKEYKVPKNNLIEPIHVGKSISNKKLNFSGDDTNDNISEKNKNYCELTALYWIWKNSNCDIVGLCHYRRYFNLKDKIYIKKVKKINVNSLDYYTKFSKYDIERILDNDYDIIVPKCNKFKETIYEQYCIYHKKEDIDKLIDVIKKLYPSYIQATNKVLNSNYMNMYNMFICKKEVLDSYCDWLFNILFEVEKIIDIDDDQYQARVFGFMSERLFNIYIEKNKLRKKELQILFIEE